MKINLGEKKLDIMLDLMGEQKYKRTKVRKRLNAGGWRMVVGERRGLGWGSLTEDLTQVSAVNLQCCDTEQVERKGWVSEQDGTGLQARE